MATKTYVIPPGTPPAKCRGCNASIFFVLSRPPDEAKGQISKVMPVNPNGTSHFIDCPKASTFRRKK